MATNKLITQQLHGNNKTLVLHDGGDESFLKPGQRYLKLRIVEKELRTAAVTGKLRNSTFLVQYSKVPGDRHFRMFLTGIQIFLRLPAPPEPAPEDDPECAAVAVSLSFARASMIWDNESEGDSLMQGFDFGLWD